MAKTNKKLARYLGVLGRRVYRPIKPLVNPLLKRIKLSYVLLVLGVVMIGGSWWELSEAEKARERAAWWPWSGKKHADMAVGWLKAGDEKMAVKELELAYEMTMIKTEGLQEYLNSVEKIVQEPERIRQEIRQGEKVLEEKPYYRDVLLRVALWYWQLNDGEKAQGYWEKASYLDPNNEEVQKVGEVISSSL